jgi:hypothetical protein
LTKKDGNYSYYTQDDKAWIFSFHHSTQLKVTQPQYAIDNYYGSLCRFGAGIDLGIQIDAHNKGSNGGWSYLGDSYELPAGMVYGSE